MHALPCLFKRWWTSEALLGMVWAMALPLMILALWSDIFVQLIRQRSVFDLGIELSFGVMGL